MSGQGYTKLEIGDLCIIDVDSVNSPTGLWWGTVVSCTEHEDVRRPWYTITAVITGPFNRDHTNPGGDTYGDKKSLPSVNYNVFPADDGTANLIAYNLKKERAMRRTVADLRIRIDELRGVIVQIHKEVPG